MINLKNITAKNFLSIGNVTQALNLDQSQLVLVLGENADQGGNESRNGVGKSSILNAITYALFGEALVPAKLDNLINKTNGKNMLVTLDFEKDGISYHIERGRKPQLFNIFVDGASVADNDAQGDSRLTQEWLEGILGMNKTVFSHIIALNTTTIPFLSMKAAEQRETIELLFGITKLSEKAEKLKELIKDTKDSIKEEEFRIKGITDSNAQIEKNIQNLKTKETNWRVQHEQNIEEHTSFLNELCELNIDEELKKHEILATIKDVNANKKSIESDIKTLVQEQTSIIRAISIAEKGLAALQKNTCPQCDQEIGAHKHDQMMSDYTNEIECQRQLLGPIDAAIQELRKTLSELTTPVSPMAFYGSLNEVYAHKSKIDKTANDLENELNKENPYIEQQETLKESIQAIDYAIKESLDTLKDHQEFLLKLLTNKDSFIRKKIIEQNLSHLNDRLRVYLDRVGSPHSVIFQSNLEVYITEYGRDLDFDIISRGEKTRIILALSWAFRDVYESMNNKLNLLFIDEILDWGLDGSGIDASIGVCTLMAREQNRNVFVISHRNELVGKVDTILTVRKENGFTTICSSDL